VPTVPKPIIPIFILLVFSSGDQILIWSISTKILEYPAPSPEANLPGRSGDRSGPFWPPGQGDEALARERGGWAVATLRLKPITIVDRAAGSVILLFPPGPLALTYWF
jgi:hypothetical protein